MRIVAKNFLSWETLEFELPEDICMINGFNYDDNSPEGSGKSAVVNSLSWGLFGKIPKDTNIDDVIREGQKSCFVCVQLDNFSVIRSRKPNDLYFEVDGKKRKGKDLRETQKMIEELVGLSFETFCQSVYFAQNYNKKFITATQEEKGKIFSEIQDLSQFDRARKETLNLIKAETETIDNLEHEREIMRREIEHNQLMIRNTVEANEKLKSQHHQKIQLLEDQEKRALDKREVLKKEVGNAGAISEFIDIEKIRTQKQDIESKLSEIQADRTTLQVQLVNFSNMEKMANDAKRDLDYCNHQKGKLQEKKGKLLEFIQNPESACPTCGTMLKGVDTGQTQNEVNQIIKELSDIEERSSEIKERLGSPIPDYTQIQETLKMFEGMVRELSKEKQLNSTREGEWVTSQTLLKFKTGELQKLESECSQYTEIIKTESEKQPQYTSPAPFREKEEELTAKVAKLCDILSVKQKRLGNLESLKDGFKEVKIHVFNSILNELTTKTNKYVQELFEVPVHIQFLNDDMKIKTTINYDGTERSLGLLSGGQFGRVSLATDLALSDIVGSRKGRVLDFIILDEYFKNLSESSMRKCLNLLKSLDKPILLIEHNSIFKQIVDSSINVELVNKISSMV